MSVTIWLEQEHVWTRPGDHTSKVVAWSGNLSPGEHDLSLLVKLTGFGTGTRSYLSKYKFDIRSTHRFDVVQGKRMTMDVAIYGHGTTQTPIERRPAIKFEEHSEPADTRLLPVETPAVQHEG
jgi:hypothetical protein